MEEEVLFSIEIKIPDAQKDIPVLTANIDKLQKANKDLAAANKDLTKAEGDNSKAIAENSKQIEANKQKIAEDTASRKNLITVVNAEANSIKSLRAQNAELLKQRNQLSTATEEGRKRIAELNKQYDINNAKIKANSSALEKQKINVGNYSNSIKEAASQLNIAGVNVGGLTSRLASFANPATAAVGIVGALGAAYAKSTIGAKDLEFAQNQLNSAISIGSNAFASLFSSAEDGQGFFSALINDFLFRISPELAIQSSIVAANQEKLEDLAREELKIRAQISDRLEENSEKLTEINESQSSYEEKVHLVNESLFNIRENEKQLTEIKTQQLEVLKLQLAIDQHNEALQTQVLEKELEIANIGKDAEKRAKSLNVLASNLLDIETKRLAVEKEKQDVQNKLAKGGQGDALPGGVQDISGEGLEGLTPEDKIIANSKEALTEIIKQENQELKELQKKNTQDYIKLENSKLAASQAVYSGLASLLGAFGIRNRAINSGLALANTFLGVTEILKAPTAPFVEPFASIVRGAQIATTIATGLGAVREINSVKGFASSGLTGTKITPGMGIPINRSNGDNMLATVKTGEVILNQRHQSMLGGPSTFARIGVPGFAGSGLTSPQVRQAAVSSESALRNDLLLNSISQMKIVTVVEDINDGQSRVAEIVDRAQVL